MKNNHPVLDISICAIRILPCRATRDGRRATINMQNKPNLLDAQMNLTSVLTKYYKNKHLCRRPENKPKQTQFQTHRLTKLFLPFTFLYPIYNLTMQNWTTQKVLNWITEHFTEKGIDSPRLSAELLLAHVLAMKRIELYTHFDKSVSRVDLDRLHDLVKRAAQHEPIAYLTGRKEFYSLEFDITQACLIPRPETELLVQKAIEFLRARTGPQYVCDLGTGSGCIAVAIAKNCPGVQIIATDISEEALSVAASNVKKHDLESQIMLLCGDLFEPIVPQLDVSKFDLIVCNPPYVTEQEYETLEANVKGYQPKIALHAGTDGLDIYRRIAEKAEQFLKRRRK